MNDCLNSLCFCNWLLNITDLLVFIEALSMLYIFTWFVKLNLDDMIADWSMMMQDKKSFY